MEFMILNFGRKKKDIKIAFTFPYLTEMESIAESTNYLIAIRFAIFYSILILISMQNYGQKYSILLFIF